jgi:hypothetical protein
MNTEIKNGITYAALAKGLVNKAIKASKTNEPTLK